MSKNISLDEIKKFWPDKAPDINIVQKYIKKYQHTPNNKRLKLMIEDIVKAGMIQKDDLTIVTVDSIQ